jgi:hypothetical protein
MILHDCFTLFILPFKTSGNIGISDASIWELSDMHPKTEALFPHVQKYLSDSQTKLVYSLKDSFKGTNVGNPEVGAIFKKTMAVSLKNGELFFKFANRKSKLNAPKILLFPVAGVGLLTFVIQFASDHPTVRELMILNYGLHKYGHSLAQNIRIVADSEKSQETAVNDKILQELARYDSSVTAKTWNFTALAEFLLHDIKHDINQDINIVNPGRFH